MWPSSSLQAPTSDAFLGMVALAPLPRPPRPRPPRPLLPPRPPRPAFVSRPMSSGILGFSFRGILRSSFHYVTESVTHEVTRSNFSLERTFLCPRTLSLPANTLSTRWSVSSRRTSTTILRVPSLLRQARTLMNLESVLEESARANPDARIRPLTHVSVDRAYQAESVGRNSLVTIVIAIHRSPNL